MDGEERVWDLRRLLSPKVDVEPFKGGARIVEEFSAGLIWSKGVQSPFKVAF